MIFKSNDDKKNEELIASLVAARQSLGAAEKTQKGVYNNKYATRESVIEVCNEALHKNNLCFLQSTQFSADTGMLTMNLFFLHSNGAVVEMNASPLPVTKNTEQGWGSAMTYLSRYSLASAMGVQIKEGEDMQHNVEMRNEKPPVKAQPNYIPGTGFRSAGNVLDAIPKKTAFVYVAKQSKDNKTFDDPQKFVDYVITIFDKIKVEKDNAKRQIFFDTIIENNKKAIAVLQPKYLQMLSVHINSLGLKKEKFNAVRSNPA
jgi:hypothetical protein